MLSGNDIATEGAWHWQNAGLIAISFGKARQLATRRTVLTQTGAAGEPNDNGGLGDYQVMYTNGLWDDEANNGSAVANGYFVEWNVDDVLDATNAVTYSITSQTVSGAFAINSDSGVITVSNGSLLNFESQTSHTITVRSTMVAVHLSIASTQSL